MRKDQNLVQKLVSKAIGSNILKNVVSMEAMNVQKEIDAAINDLPHLQGLQTCMHDSGIEIEQLDLGNFTFFY